MSHVNSVTISGLATRDPEYTEMPSGNNLASFAVAVERTWKNKDSGERQSKTSFFDVKVWGPFADIIHAKIRKADHVMVQGALEQETWVDKESGGNRSKVVITANQVDSSALYRKADGSDTPARTEGEGNSGSGGTTTPRPRSEPREPVAAGPSAQNADGDDGIPF